MKKKGFTVIMVVCIFWQALSPSSLPGQNSVQPLSLEDKRTYFREGVEFFDNKEYDKAYQQFLLLDGHYSELQAYVSYFLAFSLKHRGNNSEALTEFQQFLFRFPSHPLLDEVRFLVADILFDEGKYAEALHWYQQVSESLTGRHAELLYKLGVSLMHTENAHEAVSTLHSLVSVYPGSKYVKSAQRALQDMLEVQPALTPVWTEENLLDYANSLLKAHLYTSAIKQFSYFQSQYPGSEHIGDSKLGVAEAYFRLGQSTRGMKLLEEMGAHYGKSQPHIAAKAFYTIGMKHWYADRNRQAKRVMQRIVTEFRETEWSDNAQYVLGRIYQANGDYQAAAQWYVSLFKHHPESSFAEEALWRAGWSWYLALHFPKAVEKFHQVITVFPTGGYADASFYWKGRIL
jgi:TolA-binding protein